MPPKRKSNHLDEGTSEPKIQRSAYQTRSKTAQELEKKAKPWPTNHKGIPLPIRPCKKRDPTNWEKQIEEFNKAMLALCCREVVIFAVRADANIRKPVPAG